MKKEMISRGRIQGLTLLLVFSAALFVSSCNRTPNKPEPQRNCQQEFDQLSSMEFHSLDEAKKTVRDFLNEFEGNAQCSECITNVKQLETMFFGMDNLFSNIENSVPKDRYCAFKSMVNSNDFSSSPYETVRLTWNYLVENKKEAYMKDRLDAIDENDFKPHLMEYAKQLAIQGWGKRFHVIDCDVHGEVEVSIVDGKMAKRGVCNQVGVLMEGNFLIKRLRRQTTVFFEVEGTLKVSESNCNVVFNKGNCEYLNYMGDDPGRSAIPINVNVQVGPRY